MLLSFFPQCLCLFKWKVQVTPEYIQQCFDFPQTKGQHSSTLLPRWISQLMHRHVHNRLSKQFLGEWKVIIMDAVLNIFLIVSLKFLSLLKYLVPQLFARHFTLETTFTCLNNFSASQAINSYLKYHTWECWVYEKRKTLYFNCRWQHTIHLINDCTLITILLIKINIIESDWQQLCKVCLI